MCVCVEMSVLYCHVACVCVFVCARARVHVRLLCGGNVRKVRQECVCCADVYVHTYIRDV
jgi:hypothetical protein